MTPTTRSGTSRRHARRGGYLIVEVLLYAGLMMATIGIGYIAFDRCVQSSAGLRGSADDIANAVHAGERWRADVRQATSAARVDATAEEQTVLLPTARGEIAYRFAGNRVLRRVNGSAWVPVLERVAASTMRADQRPNVAAWIWELELQSRSKSPARIRPLFTFIAVPAQPSP